MGPSAFRLTTFLSRSLRPYLALQTRYFNSATGIRPVELVYDKYPSPDGKKDHPLLIVHGLFGSKRNWMSLSKAFARDLHVPVYTLDLRNHGTSPHVEPMTYTAMAQDILHFCSTHSLTNISLLGHSMGGKTVMSVALDPETPSGLIKNLIVADIAPSKGKLSDEFLTYTNAMQEIEDKGAQSRKEALAILSNYEKENSVQTFLLTNLDTQQHPPKFRIPIGIIADAIPALGNFPYEPGERTWEGKTLFVKGLKSKFINDRNIPIARQFFPNMRLETLEAGHWVHAEKANEFKQLVTNFIRES